MADFLTPLLNGVSPTVVGTAYSAPFNTEDFRDFAFVLRMPTTTGTGSDTLDIYIECSSDTAFADKDTRVLTLTSPTGTQGTKFTQVVGGTTLPSDTATATPLRQFWNVKDENIDRFIRVRYVIAGTATSFTGIRVDLLSNRSV
jgi:hypothetical protein